MAQQGQDRRSQRTQQALMDALISLLTVKHYDAISIQDIVDQANVGRSTFYAHFQTKDDLLMMGFRRVLESLLQHIVLSEVDQNIKLETTMLFSHAQGHYELYRTLAWGSSQELLTKEGHTALSILLQDRLTQLLSEKDESSVPLSVLSNYLAGSLLILLKWWLDNKMPFSPGDMNEMVQKLIMPGVRTALGFSNGE